jgi:hypothetical protein
MLNPQVNIHARSTASFSSPELAAQFSRFVHVRTRTNPKIIITGRAHVSLPSSNAAAMPHALIAMNRGCCFPKNRLVQRKRHIRPIMRLLFKTHYRLCVVAIGSCQTSGAK